MKKKIARFVWFLVLFSFTKTQNVLEYHRLCFWSHVSSYWNLGFNLTTQLTTKPTVQFFLRVQGSDWDASNFLMRYAQYNGILYKPNVLLLNYIGYSVCGVRILLTKNTRRGSREAGISHFSTYTLVHNLFAYVLISYRDFQEACFLEVSHSTVFPFARTEEKVLAAIHRS